MLILVSILHVATYAMLLKSMWTCTPLIVRVSYSKQRSTFLMPIKILYFVVQKFSCINYTFYSLSYRIKTPYSY